MERRHCLLLFVAAFFLLEEAGPIGHGLSRAIGLIPLGDMTWTWIKAARVGRGRLAPDGGPPLPGGWWPAALGLIAIAMVLFASLALRPLAVAFMAAGLAEAHRGPRDTALPATSLARGAAAVAVLLALVDTNSLAWLALQSAALEISELGGALVGRASVLGPTYLDLRFALFMAVTLATAGASQGQQRFLGATLPIAGIAGSVFALAVFAALLPDLHAATARAMAAAHPVGELDSWGRLIANLPLLGLPFFLPNVLWLRATTAVHPPVDPGASARPESRDPWRARIAAVMPALIASLLALAAVLLPPRGMSRGPARPGTVLLYEHGFLNWEQARHGSYGEYSGGMFGNLPHTIASLGIPARRVPVLDEPALAGAAAVVLINLDRAIPAAELDALWRFVRRGGGLLILGDHTFRKEGGRNWLNETLAPSHIRYRFDSAQFFIGGWLHSYQYRPHPTTVGLGDDRNQPGIVVGASLELQPPAAPLIVGRYGFSDAGVPEAEREGHIGDLSHQPGEPVGDLVLAASERVGQGRLLVIGDTSGFTNLIAVRSHRFMARVFRWLVRGGEAGGDASREGLSLACALGAMALLLRRHGPAVAPALSARAAPVALLPAFVVPLALLHAASAPLDAPPRGSIAYVDESHAERFSPDGWRDHGIAGLYLNLFRGGYLALAMDAFDPSRLSTARLFVLVAPASPVGLRERAALRAFVERGGWLLVSVGYEERAAVVELLSGFGVEIEGTPLGAQGSVTARGDSLTFRKAWPVRAPGATILAQAGDYPLVVRRVVGLGAVVVIGDPALLLNANLEHAEHAHEQTIAFLRWLFEHHLPPNAPAVAVR